ncbi:MAG: MBL fold metallo-hydrolase [Piscinibacter sp.]|uniref:MBL fold metallo-hydrolase n=1 Tax=Piscinibacter sp. TaxID=1903157 RepID=UPI003D130D45
MQFRQIRSATLNIEYAGKRFLIDPMLDPKGAQPGYPATVNSHLDNPLVDLPCAIEEVIDVDAVIVTHTHPDHWDETARKRIPKDLLVFAQTPYDEWQIQLAGFRNTRVLDGATDFAGITLSKTPGQHGRGALLEGLYGQILGDVCGVVFRHPDEKTLYLAGDTVWYEGVAETLANYQPDVIILNSADARVLPDEPIIMGTEDVREVYRAAPGATLIASHMDAVNPGTLSRAALRRFLDDEGMTDRVLVPEDGERYTF